MQQMIYSVSQVNLYLKDKLDSDPFLGSLCIRGELSNYKVYPSGHHYFTLKDAEGALRCVMFRSSASRLRFRPENGMKVLALGRITVFPRDGAYQLYCETLSPDGIGDLHVAYEQLKAKLMTEGLFDASHKKPLPRYPHRIAIVTSSAGAAVRDMIRILGKRYPLAHVSLLPVRVQGAEAPAEICGAIAYANRWKLSDVLIVGRGGGSIEDLWAFNDERVARAIYASEIPVVSAVGHEPDVTISDFVADVRAATPSNAAELVAPDQAELRKRLDAVKGRLETACGAKLTAARQRLATLQRSRAMQSPLNYYQDKRMILDYQQRQLVSDWQRLSSAARQRLIRLSSLLDAISPLKVLGRGYAIVRRPGGQVVRSAGEVQIEDPIDILLNDGQISARVTQKEERHGSVQDL